MFNDQASSQISTTPLARESQGKKDPFRDSYVMSRQLVKQNTVSSTRADSNIFPMEFASFANGAGQMSVSSFKPQAVSSRPVAKNRSSKKKAAFHKSPRPLWERESERSEYKKKFARADKSRKTQLKRLNTDIEVMTPNRVSNLTSRTTTNNIITNPPKP